MKRIDKRAPAVQIERSEVTVTARATPSADPELLRRFGHWLHRVLLEDADKDRGPS